jgi:hypothetical protein
MAAIAWGDATRAGRPRGVGRPALCPRRRRWRRSPPLVIPTGCGRTPGPPDGPPAVGRPRPHGDWQTGDDGDRARAGVGHRPRRRRGDAGLGPSGRASTTATAGFVLRSGPSDLPSGPVRWRSGRVRSCQRRVNVRE